MRPLRVKILHGLWIYLFLSFFLTPSLRAQSSDSLQWGEAADGVQMSISADDSTQAVFTTFRVTFRNLGDKDTNLNLGTIGGQGPRPCKLGNRVITCTFNFNLSLTDASGATRKFSFNGMQFIAGRLDAYIVSLPAHSSYALDLGIDQFCSCDAGNFNGLRLHAGRYEISLRFEGRDPHMNLGQEYIKKMSFWKGELMSNTLTVETGSQPNHARNIATANPPDR